MTWLRLLDARLSPWELRFRYRDGLCAFRCGKNDNGTGLFPSTSVSAVGIIPTLFHTYCHLNVILIRRTSGKKMDKFKTVQFLYRGTVDGRVLSHCFVTVDVKVIIKNPVLRRWLRISGLYVTKLFQKSVPIGDII